MQIILFKELKKQDPNKELDKYFNTAVAGLAINATILDLLVLESELNNKNKNSSQDKPNNEGSNSTLRLYAIGANGLAATAASIAAIHNIFQGTADKVVSNAFAALASSLSITGHLLKISKGKKDTNKILKYVNAIKQVGLDIIAIAFNLLSIYLDRCAEELIRPVSDAIEKLVGSRNFLIRQLITLLMEL